MIRDQPDPDALPLRRGQRPLDEVVAAITDAEERLRGMAAANLVENPARYNQLVGHGHHPVGKR